ncbi:MAG: radical SAM protein [Acidobacteria bacterium]|nr:radical SAM protein [Acidobacteriota bacterium]
MKLIPVFLPEKSCPYRCAFCNVRIANGSDAPVHSPADIGGIIETALKTLSVRHRNEPVEIAFFGGTFTAGNPEVMEKYLNSCTPFLERGAVSGIRISTRPDHVNDEIIQLLKQSGVTTVEIGVESFDNHVLLQLNRGHSAETATAAIHRLKTAGFVTGIHLMAGCPGETAASFQKTITAMVQSRPDTVRIHPLLVLAGTRLAEEGYQAPDCDTILEQLAAATHCAEAAGISVIRIGLQPTDSLNRPGHILSGCFHAALRHRVMSRIYRRFFEKYSREESAAVTVSTKHLSYAVGFKRENAVLFPDFRFSGEKSVKAWDVRINGTCYHMLTEGLYEIERLFER